MSEAAVSEVFSGYGSLSKGKLPGHRRVYSDQCQGNCCCLPRTNAPSIWRKYSPCLFVAATAVYFVAKSLSHVFEQISTTRDWMLDVEYYINLSQNSRGVGCNPECHGIPGVTHHYNRVWLFLDTNQLPACQTFILVSVLMAGSKEDNKVSFYS